jgi:hypothetical protein
MSDFDRVPAMVTPPPQQTFDLGDARKGPCRYCGRFNLPDEGDRVDRYDCCDPRPVRVLPLSERSPAARASYSIVLAELDAEESAFECRLAALSTSTASAATQQ